MHVQTSRILSVLGVLGCVSLLTVASTAAGSRVTPVEAPPPVDALTTGQDCSKGCTECQKRCHESTCMSACTAQWSGCCMTAGLKPPAMGSCACTN